MTTHTPSKIGQTGLIFGLQSSSLSLWLCMQDYMSLRLLAVIYGTLVNT